MIIYCECYILYYLASERKQKVIYCQNALALERKDALKAYDVISVTVIIDFIFATIIFATFVSKNV